MIKKNMLVVSILTALVLANASVAGAFGIEAALGGWRQNPSGTLGYDIVSDNDILDLENDLNYEDEDRLFGRLIIDMPLILPNIYILATPMEYNATGHVADGFKFGDYTFDPGEFDSKTVLDSYDFTLFYGLPILGTASLDRFSIDLGLNFRIYDYELNVHQASTGLNESESGTLVIPMFFVAARFSPIEELSFEVEGRGITYNHNDLYSLIGRVKVKVFGPLFAAGGYRYEKFNLDEKDVVADIEFSGPFLEAGFSF